MNRNLITGISIILIGMIIAGGIFFTKTRNVDDEFIFDESDYKLVEVNPINEQDHILGSPNAKIFIIQYTHLECTYTQRFHETMKRIISEYGPSEDVAWIIRHFPVPELYPKSYVGAIAIECVTNINRENRGIFWEYLDKIFSRVPTEINSDKLRSAAISVGTDPDLYDSCIITEKYDNKIINDIKDAKKLVEVDSNFMTPYNLIVTNFGFQTRVSGIIDYKDLKNMIDQILANLY